MSACARSSRRHLRRHRRPWRDPYVRRAGGADHADPCPERRSAASRTRSQSPPAAPRRPPPVIAQMEAMGFAVTHLYGLTECYGPATICPWQPGLDELPLPGKAAFMARQGVSRRCWRKPPYQPRHHGAGAGGWRDLGEVMLRGNTVMKGYLSNPAAEEAFAGGWFHTGDLGGDAPGWLYRGQGPGQGHHHLRRREHLDAGGRGGALRATRRDGSRGGGARRTRNGARRRMRLRHAEAGRRGTRGRDHRLVPRAASRISNARS